MTVGEITQAHLEIDLEILWKTNTVSANQCNVYVQLAEPLFSPYFAPSPYLTSDALYFLCALPYPLSKLTPPSPVLHPIFVTFPSASAHSLMGVNKPPVQDPCPFYHLVA